MGEAPEKRLAAFLQESSAQIHPAAVHDQPSLRMATLRLSGIKVGLRFSHIAHSRRFIGELLESFGLVTPALYHKIARFAHHRVQSLAIKCKALGSFGRFGRFSAQFLCSSRSSGVIHDRLLTERTFTFSGWKTTTSSFPRRRESRAWWNPLYNFRRYSFRG